MRQPLRKQAARWRQERHSSPDSRSRRAGPPARGESFDRQRPSRGRHSQAMKKLFPRSAAAALALAGAVAKVCVLAWALSPAPAHANEAVRTGRALFLGEQALPARHATQSQPLPTSASRCINCHSAPGLRPAAAAAAAAATATATATATAIAAAGSQGASFGPALNSAALLQLQARRGGPPSRYDAPALCRALREGIDPAGVMLPTAMPRYVLDDAQCRTLWTFLTSDL